MQSMAACGAQLKSRKEVVDVKKKGQSSVWRSSVQKHADYLVESMSAMRERDAVRGSPELVDLNRALIRAIRIRNFIRKRSKKRKFWPGMRSVLQDVLVLYEVARMIHSLLSNCSNIIPLEHVHVLYRFAKPVKCVG